MSKSYKERIADKRAKVAVKIDKLETKKMETYSDRKEKSINNKIRKQKSLYSSYGEILRSPTSENKSTKINVNLNIAKNNKPKKK